MSVRPSTHRRSLREIFIGPLVVAVISAIGLVAALVGDGVWDVTSWLALAVPTVLLLYFLMRATRRREGRTSDSGPFPPTHQDN